jgi:hypothetical protein
MKKNHIIFAVLIVAAFVIGLVFYKRGCKLSCNREGYKRSCLANDCYGLQNTPVDYAFKYPRGWQRNPHWEANPADKYQPLEYGPVDFFDDTRKLISGTLYKQYRNDWEGCGNSTVFLVNNEKTRFDLRNVGDVQAAVLLDNAYHLRFGPQGFNNTELTYQEPDTTQQKIYGGERWLMNDKIGD